MHHKLISAAFLILVSFAFVSASHLSHQEWLTQQAYPSISFVKLCYVVMTGYGAILLSYFIKKDLLKQWIFWGGVTPVLLLALAGSIMQSLGEFHCPKTENGFPMCYISLMLIISVIVLREMQRFFARKES